MAHDLRRDAEELERRLSALGMGPGAEGAQRRVSDSAARTLAAEEVARAIEQIRGLVEGLAELQGVLQGLRSLKIRLDRRPTRAADR